MIRTISLGQPSEIGFYQYKSAELCGYSLYGNSIETDPQLKSQASNVDSLLGLIFHDLIEKLYQIDDTDKRFQVGNEYIAQKSQQFLDDPNYWFLGDLKSYRKTGQLLSRIVFAPPPKGFSQSEGIKVEFERKIKSSDNLLGGRVDKIVFKSDEIEIHEFKSSITQDDSALLEQHKEQLLYYAAIISENYPNKKIRGFIYGSELRPLEVNAEGKTIKEFADSVRMKIRQIMEFRGSPEELQVPSEENCINCKLRPVCASYLKYQTHVSQSEAFVLEGTVQSSQSISKVSAGLTLSSSAGNVTISVPSVHPILKTSFFNKTYTFSGLRRVHNKFDVTFRTVIYENT